VSPICGRCADDRVQHRIEAVPDDSRHISMVYGLPGAGVFPELRQLTREFKVESSSAW
jgi:hypothetical protein